MIHEILPVGPLQCNCSIFGDETTRQGLVIDPGDNLEEIEQILARHGLRVTAIVVTHAHIDHIGGAARLHRSTGAPVYMSERDLFLARQLDVQAGWLGIPTLDSGQAVNARRRPDRDPRPRRVDHDRPGAGMQLLSTGLVAAPRYFRYGSICLNSSRSLRPSSS
ncbi:MAG: MBL fold metallo-hydrolase [Acidobacteria bacterium]|nr:MBL fold metallo-hydrolase [Acidobacteriota bacterium]